MKRKVTAGVFVAMMAASLMMGGIQVKAAGSNYSDVIGGTKTTTFDKYLVMDTDAYVPNVTFTYTVTAGTAKAYDVDGNKFQILAGVDADKVTMAGVGTADAAANTIVYTPEDTKNSNIVKQDENQLVKDYEKASEKYAAKTATLDFSACNFKEPGIYRYILSEKATTNTAITNDADNTRVIDVYVHDVSEGAEKKLTVAGFVLHSNTDDAPDVSMGENNGSAGSYTATKSQGFTNKYDTSDLTFRKEVAGNQASHDKYFEFTVSISNATKGTVYDVDITGADGTSGNNEATIDANKGKTNPEKLTADNDGKVTQKFYLQHGQEIRIEGIAKDTKYNVTENKEDYKSEGAAVVGYTAPVNGIIQSADLKTSYLNTRNGVIPTGVVMTVAPFAGAVILGGLGVVVFAGRKKREDEK
ncbi:hypothetical protein KE530_01090 [Clostridiaceae bacterium Marseille-Q4145]|nr:hypothetical protein [Clostridiaceae bacterium Marseille-Q4145]